MLKAMRCLEMTQVNSDNNYVLLLYQLAVYMGVECGFLAVNVPTIVVFPCRASEDWVLDCTVEF
jgi:hypothetical protein